MNPRDLTITTERLEIASIEWGNPEGEPVIAIHGWMDNAASFTRLAQTMNLSAIRFIAIDLPGHGLSEHRGAGQIYHLMEYVVDVINIIKALNLQSVSLLGHSLGGIIAMFTAVAVPTKVKQLVMLDSLGPMADKEDDAAEQLKKAISKICLSERRLSACYRTIDEAVDARLSGFTKLNRDAATLLVERNLASTEDGFVWRSDARLRDPSLVRLSEAQVQGLMKHVKCPVSLVVGDEGYISLDTAKNPRLGCIAAIEIHQVRGRHHFHLDGDVEETANIINRFIRINCG